MARIRRPNPLLTLCVGLLLLLVASGCGTDAAGTDAAAQDTEDAAVVDVQLDIGTADGDSADGQVDVEADASGIDAAETDVVDVPDVAEVADVAEVEDTDAAPDAEVADAAEVEVTDAEDADAEDADADAEDADADADAAEVEDADAAEDTDADADDTGDGAATDAVPPPLEGTIVMAPTDPSTYPPAAMAEISVALGVPAATTHSLCVAAGDLDGDGRDDLVVTERNATKARLHTLLMSGPAGQPSAKHVYTEVDTSLLIPTSACVLVDYTDDGKLDLFVGGESGLGLFAGDGKGGFVDVTATWLPYIMNFSTWSVSVADFDGDADLDVFVGTGSPSFDAGNPGPGPACGSKNCGYTGNDFFCALVTQMPDLEPLQNRMMIRGAQLPLVDATAQWKVPPGGLLSAPQAMDVDLDGKMDVFVSDDFGVHYLLHNQGGSFVQHGTGAGFHPYGHGMGFGVLDADSDGKPDLMLADEGPSHVYVQQAQPAAGGPVSFVDMGAALGVWYATWSASSWSPLVADFNQDGYDDVFLGGALWTPPEQLGPVTAGCTVGGKLPYEGHPNIDLLLLGTPEGGFVAQRLPTGPYSHFMAISQVLVDVDGDGDLDVLQARPYPNLSSTVRLWRNDLPKAGGTVHVRLVGKPGNRDAIGARVSAKVGGKLRTRWMVGHGGFGGGWLRHTVFGTGSAGGVTDVQVRWPDGKVTSHGDATAGATLTLTWP